MAEPEAGEVVAVIGDGTYLMAPTELVTAVEQGLKVTVVLLVNGGYQSIHALQRSVLGAGFGTEFRAEVDYAANARSLGCATWTAETPEALGAALHAAREQPRPAVIVCPVEPHRMLLGSGAWWDLGVPETSQRGLAYRAGSARQRYFG